MTRHPIIQLYAVMTCFLFAVMVTAQILGFLELYNLWVTIPATVMAGWLALRAYDNYAVDWLAELRVEAQNTAVDKALIVASVVILGGVFILRMVLYPASELALNVPIDLMTYHGSKILDLARTGSMWSLAIPYGQYPNGFESLSAFAMLFTESLTILGIVNALTTIWLWLTVALLIIRYLKTTLSIALFVATLCLFLPMVYSQLLLIGKNDMFLSATILAGALHAPIGSRHFHPFGLAFVTMMSLATKATGLYILFYLWGLVLWHWYLAYRAGKASHYLTIPTFLLTLLIMFPGGLWVIRNVWVLGVPFTSEVSGFFQTSIASNLTDALMWQVAGVELLVVAGITLGVGLGAGFLQRLGWGFAGLLLMTAFTFMVTPLTAYLTFEKVFPAIQWRFVSHGVILLVIAIIVILYRAWLPMYTWFSNKHMLHAPIGIGIIISSFLLVGVLIFDDEIPFYDPALVENVTDPFGDGAVSIYDYIEDEIDSGVVYLQGGSWFAAMISNPDVILTSGSLYPLGHDLPQQEILIPDYVVVHRNRTINTLNGIPPIYEWELLHENRTGRVYRRVDVP